MAGDAQFAREDYVEEAWESSIRVKASKPISQYEKEDWGPARGKEAGLASGRW